jgi:3-dehydroquinate dehydratase-2
LEGILQRVAARASALGVGLSTFQSSSEGALVDEIQRAARECAGIVINGAAYSHTSIAIRDALEASEKPVIEVHLSNVYAREPFRHHSYISAVARGVVCGFGGHSYVLALEAMVELLKPRP